MFRKTFAHPSFRGSLFALALFLGGGHGQAFAQSLDFKSISVSDAASQIEKAFHVTLDLGSGINLQRSVTFSVPNVQDSGALLRAVNSLASSIDADYRKEFVIGPAANGVVPPDPVVDAPDAMVSFDSETQNAAKAISAVAALDDATPRISPSLQGSISFSDIHLTVRDAISQIALQTHTEWKVAYTIIPHTSRNSSPGRIVGYSGGGQPIIEMVNVMFPGETPGSSNPPSTIPNMPSPQEMQDPVYQSAVVRGDVSAMLKFQHSRTPVTNPETGN